MRRATWLLTLVAILLGVPASRADDVKGAKMDKLWVFVGTYTGPKSKGIYRFELDLASGKATQPALAGATANPSFLAIHPGQRFLYAVGEISNFKKAKAGAVNAFALDPKTGNLTLLNQESSGGGGPCHLVVDKAGKNVLVANYGGGSVAALPIGADGKLASMSSFIQHKGASADKSRQEAPHAHSINLDATNQFAFAADLGLDQVLIYRFDSATGKLSPHGSASVAPGSGPRHFAFHPTGKYAYVINEMKNTITAFAYDPQQGTLTTLQTVPTLPEGFKGKSYTAEVVVHPSGKFVYGSNRGHNSIAIFTVDPASGKLTARGHQAEKIKWPRNFAIDPTGTYLLAANEQGHNLVVFRIDQATGDLAPTGTVVEVPSPVCVRMMPRP